MSFVRITQGLNSASKLAAVARRLRRSPRSILSHIDTDHLQAVMEEKARELTPEGDGKEGGHLRDSWKTKKEATEYTMRVTLYSMWERLGKRKQARLRSVEEGSRAVNIIVKEDFKFRSELIIEDYGRKATRRRLVRPWVTFEAGDIINRTARPGLHVLAQVKSWLPREVANVRAQAHAALDDLIAGRERV